jgi:ABC-type oligopeptide transport system substrate-binding subunit
MKKYLIVIAALALSASPVLAQSYGSSTSTTTTQSSAMPQPLNPPDMPPAPDASVSRTVTHSTDGLNRTDSYSKQSTAPDGSTSSQSTTIQHNVQ